MDLNKKFKKDLKYGTAGEKIVAMYLSINGMTIVNDESTKIYKWHNSPLNTDSFNNISFNTKELTFDYPHNIKRIYQIYSRRRDI